MVGAARCPHGTTRSSARTDRCLRRTNVSISCSKKCRAAAAAITAGRSTASPGPPPTRCSRPRPDKRYRLVMTNKSGDNHPVHLHRHTFEVTKVGDKATAGVMKDTINMTRFSTVEIDFIADDPGLRCSIVIIRITRTKASWAW